MNGMPIAQMPVPPQNLEDLPGEDEPLDSLVRMVGADRGLYEEKQRGRLPNIILDSLPEDG